MHFKPLPQLWPFLQIHENKHRAHNNNNNNKTIIYNHQNRNKRTNRSRRKVETKGRKEGRLGIEIGYSD